MQNYPQITQITQIGIEKESVELQRFQRSYLKVNLRNLWMVLICGLGFYQRWLKTASYTKVPSSVLLLVRNRSNFPSAGWLTW